MFDKISTYIYRVTIAVAFLLFFIGIWDRIIKLFGWTLAWGSYKPVRLLELSVMLIIFVIAFICRQIREELKKININRNSL